MTSALPFRSTLLKSKWLLQIEVIVTQTSNRSSTITSTSLYHSQHYHRRTEIAKIIIYSSSSKGTFCICTVIWPSQTHIYIPIYTVFMSFPFTTKQMCTLYPAERLFYIAIVSYVLKFMKQKTIQIQFEYKKPWWNWTCGHRGNSSLL